MEMFNIFQTPWPMFVAAIIVFIVIVTIRLNFPEKRRFWQLLIPLALAGLSFSLDYYVRTDLEKIEHIFKLSAKSVSDSDIDLFAPLISTNYSDKVHRSKDQFISFCNTIFSQSYIEKVKVMYNKFEIDPPDANSQFEVVVHLKEVSSDMVTPEMVFIKMTLFFKKTESKEWFISSSQIRSVNNHTYNWTDTR